MRAAIVAGAVALAMLQGAPRALAAQQTPSAPARSPAADGARPMGIEPIGPGLDVIRGPVDPGCMLGCKPGQVPDDALHEPGVTAARVTPEGVVLVDAKFAQHVPEILAQGIELIQQRDLKALYEANKAPGAGGGSARITFGDRLAVELGGERVEALHYVPTGHTRGDTFVYFPDLKAVHMGDLVIRGMPHIDYKGGGSAAGFVTAIYQLLKLDFEVAIPGHGAVLTRDEVRDYARRMETLNARGKDAARRGVPLEGFAAALGLEDLGWAHSASTTNFLTNDLAGFRAEMIAAVAADKAGAAPLPR